MSDYDNQGGMAGHFGYGLGETTPIRRRMTPFDVRCPTCDARAGKACAMAGWSPHDDWHWSRERRANEMAKR